MEKKRLEGQKIMKLVIISDSHGKHSELEIPKCDTIIHCGDFSSLGRYDEVFSFLEWFEKTPAKYKIFISGNHDLTLQTQPEWFSTVLKSFPDLIYLQDSEIEIEGYFFYGAPWTPEFYNWAWMLPRGSNRLAETWNKIPSYCDVLITHGPAYGTADYNGRKHVGCELLRDKVLDVKPLLHVCGHIHASYGVYVGENTTTVNAAVLDEQYNVANRPIVINI